MWQLLRIGNWEEMYTPNHWTDKLPQTHPGNRTNTVFHVFKPPCKNSLWMLFAQRASRTWVPLSKSFIKIRSLFLTRVGYTDVRHCPPTEPQNVGEPSKQQKPLDGQNSCIELAGCLQAGGWSQGCYWGTSPSAACLLPPQALVFLHTFLCSIFNLYL